MRTPSPLTATALHALPDPVPPYLLFTGKGGVGKTSVACATALALADAGRRVLIVSTDPASNLDEMLGVDLSGGPADVPGAPGLRAMNIDPEAAAEAYRQRVLAQLDPAADETERATVREQLSGACTTEIAAFDAFAGLLAGDAGAVDHVIFDTAPTGHTLRLLSLPAAWTGFLAGNDRGASCLGPHSGLTLQQHRFEAAMAALADPARTLIVLVTRPDAAALREAERTRAELATLSLRPGHLAVNGVFRTAHADDPVAAALQAQGEAALAGLSAPLATLPRSLLPLRAFDMVGLAALRALADPTKPEPAPVAEATGGADTAALPHGLGPLVDELLQRPAGLVMVMGKGGVGKTTVAAALAVALAARGRSVHLSTTDPAAHLADTLHGGLSGLTVDRIDPAAETARYVEKVMATRGKGLSEAEQALMREDLKSPCTEEVAVFHAFSRTVASSRSAFVVLDTAPTGHTLLLMDATGAYHRQMVRELSPGTSHLTTPLMRLQDAAHTHVLLVTLPETTPVSEAAALQQDLARASIQPWAWVINRSLAASGVHEPVLAARLAGERRQWARVRALAPRAVVLPWCPVAPVGVAALEELAQGRPVTAA